MTATFTVPPRVAANIARRHAADERRQCLYGCRAHARPYPGGTFCDEHSPWALAGQPNPNTQVDPTRTADALRARMLDEPDADVRAIRAQSAGNSETRPEHSTDSITDRWRAFDQANPHVRARLVELVEQAIARGEKRVGIGALFEWLRWSERTETNGNSYRLDNTLRAPAVRALIADRPEWERLFEVRQRRSA